MLTAETAQPANEIARALAGRVDFATEDAAAARRYVLQNFNGRCRLRFGDDASFVRFSDARALIGSTEIQLVRTDCASEYYTVSDRHADSHIMLQIPLDGIVEIRCCDEALVLQPGKVAVIGNRGETRKHWRGPSTVVNLFIAIEALERVLAGELGVPLGERLQFGAAAALDLEAIGTLWRLVRTICSDLAGVEASFAAPALGQQAERLLHLLALKCLPHNYRDRLEESPSRAAPFYVRRVEQLILARYAEKLSVEEMVAASGASARTLHYGFRRYRGTTPMRFLKLTRLRHARAALRREERAPGTVTQIAIRSGYDDPSRFARDYRAQFGERPLDTMRCRGAISNEG